MTTNNQPPKSVDRDGVSLREQITGLILDIPNAYKLADAIMSLIHHHDQRIIAEAEEDTIFKIMSAKTEGLFDDGDLFIKRKPIEDVAISIIGYEKFKAMQEAVNALTAQQEQKHE